MSNAVLPVYGPMQVVFERGEGVRLFDDKGRSYLDFIAGIAVNSLGHNHPVLVNALKEQAGKVWHLSNMFKIPGQEKLAARYCENSFADKVFFTNSGTEAIEASIKLARRYHWAKGDVDRIGIVSFTGSFHGRTIGAINAGGQDKYREGFGPRMEGFSTLEYGDEAALKAAIADPKTAAMLIEPVQGEGGVREVSHDMLRMMREECDKHGVLIIYDEIQCGAGRTGKLFHHQWIEGAEPDILAAAKGIGGGFPLGACLATDAVADAMAKGTHGSTFGGNPMAMAIGNAVLDVVLGDGFLEQVQRVSGDLTQALESLKGRYPDLVEDITGSGLLRGIKMTQDPTPLREALMERGLIIGTAGNNVLRLAPPLIASSEDIRAAVEIIDEQFAEMSSASGS